MKYLTEEEIISVIDSLKDDVISFEMVRPHNKGEIRKPVTMEKSKLKDFISEAIEEGHQPGGNLELSIPSINQKLVGHHDGIYWLE